MKKKKSGVEGQKVSGKQKKSKLFLIISILCAAILTVGLSLSAVGLAAAAEGGTCGERSEWSFDETTGILTISGSDEMYDYDVYDTESTEATNFAPWLASYKDTITKIVIGEGMTYIGNNAFSPCSALTEVELAESLLSIGEAAFFDCDALTAINLPAAVNTLGEAVFAECDSLTAITVAEANSAFETDAGVLYTKGWNTLVCYPAGITLTSYKVSGSASVIGDYAFCGSNYLEQVLFDGSISKIGIAAFGMCEALQLFTVPDAVTVIPEGAFMGCVALENVVFPEGLTQIDNLAFALCQAMSKVDVPNKVKSIGAGAFGGCTAMTSAFFGKNVTSIGDQAFASNTSLSKAYFYGNAPSNFGADVFTDCADNFIIYYWSTASGWTTPTWNGYNTEKYVNRTISGMKAVAVNHKVNVSWNVCSGVDGYYINVQYADGSLYKNYSTTKSSCNFTNLTNDTEYIFKVRAYTTESGSKQYGAYCTAVSATPFDDTVQNLKVVKGDNKAKLSWTAIDGADGYYIYAMYGDDSKYKTYVTTKTTCNFTRLINGDTYKFKVREYKLNAAGSKVYGSYSSTVSVVPQLAGVNDLQVISLNKKLHVNWEAADIVTDWASMDKAYYYIYVTNADGSLYKTYKTLKNYCNFNNLINDQEYTFKVRVCYTNSAGTLCYSKYCTAVTAAPVYDIVQNLTATSYDSKINLSWDAVDGVFAYQIYAMYADGSKYKTYNTTKTTCNFTNLTNGNTYKFKIRPYHLNAANGLWVFSDYCPVVSAVPGV